MKITYIEIEATADELKTTETLGDALIKAMTRVLSNVGNQPQYEQTKETEEGEEE